MDESHLIKTLLPDMCSKELDTCVRQRKFRAFFERLLEVAADGHDWVELVILGQVNNLLAKVCLRAS